MTSKRNAWHRRRRQALFDQQKGLCHWCKKPMLPPSLKGEGRVARNECTLDHLFDRFDPRRREQALGEARYVAACHLCNYKRGRASDRANTARLRSQHGGGERPSSQAGVAQ